MNFTISTRIGAILPPSRHHSACLCRLPALLHPLRAFLEALSKMPLAARLRHLLQSQHRSLPKHERFACWRRGFITAAEGQVLLNHEERALQLEQEALQARASFYAAATQQASPATALPGTTSLSQATSSVLEMPLQSNAAADSCSRNACHVDVSFASDHANTSEVDEKHHEVQKTTSESIDSSAEDLRNTVTDSGLTARKCLDCWNPMPPLCATCIKVMKHKQVEGRAKWRTATEAPVDKGKLFKQMSHDAMKPNRNTKERCFHSLSSFWHNFDTGAWNDEERPPMKYLKERKKLWDWVWVFHILMPRGPYLQLVYCF